MTSTGVSLGTVGAGTVAIDAAVPALVAEKFASKLFNQDATLWGKAAEDEASKRLSWVGLARGSRPLVGEISALREKFTSAGLDRVVLCGMGGSSLAPEVICATGGVPLVVLDSSQPDMVRDALEKDLEKTVVVVSSKSGSTVETDSQRRAYEDAFTKAGIDPRERIVIVTDPGSPLDKSSREGGFTVVNADPGVGGRYSALTAFGLVPSGLAGADIETLLDDAESVVDLLAADDDANPGLRLGAILGGTKPLRDKVLLADAGTPNKGFGDWAEQLIAESTGKDGKGLLPVVVGTDIPEKLEADENLVLLTASDDERELTGDATTVISGSLGAQFMVWEVATAVAGHLIGINPFDQPDVESAKAAARELLDNGIAAGDKPAFTDGAVEVSALGPDFLGDAKDLNGALSALVGELGDTGYLAIMAYLDRIADADLESVRTPIERKLSRPVTFGWGPRFLHSTGQYHKGGPAIGVYLQITADPKSDLEVPGRDFTFGQFCAAQAGGDAKVLADHKRPVLRLHITDLAQGLLQVKSALEQLAGGEA